MLFKYVTSDALNFVVNTVVIQYCVYYEIYSTVFTTKFNASDVNIWMDPNVEYN